MQSNTKPNQRLKQEKWFENENMGKASKLFHLKEVLEYLVDAKFGRFELLYLVGILESVGSIDSLVNSIL